MGCCSTDSDPISQHGSHNSKMKPRRPMSDLDLSQDSTQSTDEVTGVWRGFLTRAEKKREVKMDWENFIVQKDSDEIDGLGKDELGVYTFRGSLCNESCTFEATKHYEHL